MAKLLVGREQMKSFVSFLCLYAADSCGMFLIFEIKKSVFHSTSQMIPECNIIPAGRKHVTNTENCDTLQVC